MSTPVFFTTPARLSHGFRILVLLSTLLWSVMGFAQSAVTIDSFSVSPSKLSKGQVATVTVNLSRPATQNTTIRLDSSDMQVLPVPSRFGIPLGSSSGSFTVTAGIATKKAFVTVSVGLDGVWQRQQVTVLPVTDWTLDVPNTPVQGGTRVSGKIKLIEPAGATGETFTLSSTNSALATVTSTVTILPGQTEGAFVVRTFPVKANDRAQINVTSPTKSASFRFGVKKPLLPSSWSLIGTNTSQLNGGGLTAGQLVAGATTRLTSRILHVAATQGTTVRLVRLVYANYNQEGGRGENPNANSIFIKAAIEKPSKRGLDDQRETPIKVTFGGQEEVEIPPGEIVVSDSVRVELKTNERFFTRTCQRVNSPTDLICGGNSVVGGTDTGGKDTGEGVSAGDLAYSGTIKPTYLRSPYGPSAIVGSVVQPLRTLALCGDSIMAGSEDGGFRDQAGGFGERVATRQFELGENPAIDPFCGYVHLARGGETARDFLSSQIRFSLSTLASTVLVNYLTNDLSILSSTYTERDIKNVLVQLVQRWTDMGKRVIITTCLPKSFSSDGFLTSQGQWSRPFSQERKSINEWLKSPTGLRAEVEAGAGQIVVWDTAAAVEQQLSESQTVGWPSATVVDSGWIDSNLSLSTSSFRDSRLKGRKNAYVGHTVTFLTGPSAGYTHVVRYMEDNGKLSFRATFPKSPNVGDYYIVSSSILTADGLHPSSAGHVKIAQSFNYDWIVP